MLLHFKSTEQNRLPYSAKTFLFSILTAVKAANLHFKNKDSRLWSSIYVCVADFYCVV